MRLIDVDALADLFAHEATYARTDVRVAMFGAAVALIRRFPTIEARPVVRGEWVWEKREAFTEECSICGCTVYWDDGRPHRYNFCPNCGARMDGDRNG